MAVDTYDTNSREQARNKMSNSGKTLDSKTVATPHKTTTKILESQAEGKRI